ncbi:MAG: nuclear transport factor 2 family protein [Caulobacteraceae bacterium]|nr:nuclear transport factor 2 family protein [Caulobacteraceae bacterium]
MSPNETVVRACIAAWSRLDVEEFAGYFAPDGVYHNMPLGPVGGHDKLRPFIQAFLKGWTATSWDIRAILAAGDLVDAWSASTAHGSAISPSICRAAAASSLRTADQNLARPFRYGGLHARAG